VFDAGSPAALTKFSYSCTGGDGNCPAYSIQYSDTVTPGWSLERSQYMADGDDQKIWRSAAVSDGSTTSLEWPSVGCHRFWRYLINAAEWSCCAAGSYYGWRFYGAPSAPSPQQLHWGDAQGACMTRGMQLATVHSVSDSDAVTALLLQAGAETSGAWLGMSGHPGGLWVWSDGQSLPLSLHLPLPSLCLYLCLSASVFVSAPASASVFVSAGTSLDWTAWSPANGPNAALGSPRQCTKAVGNVCGRAWCAHGAWEDADCAAELPVVPTPLNPSLSRATHLAHSFN
jgi:hypothetical protein